MATVEYRVRPVERFVVTKFESSDTATSSCITIGEFPNLETATTVKHAFEYSAGNCPPKPTECLPPSLDQRKFAVICHGFDVQTMVFYATGKDQAERTKEVSELKYGGEWQIFEQA